MSMAKRGAKNVFHDAKKGGVTPNPLAAAKRLNLLGYLHEEPERRGVSSRYCTKAPAGH